MGLVTRFPPSLPPNSGAIGLPCLAIGPPTRTAVHVRHVAQKATTQRDGRAASLRRTGRRRASAGKAARRSVVLSYRRYMPARKRPAPEDAVTARQTLLDGLARDADIFELLSELAPPQPRDNTFPGGEVFLHVAADALDWCRASRADPLPLEGLRERFLPECTFRGMRKQEAPVRGAGRSSPSRRD